MCSVIPTYFQCLNAFLGLIKLCQLTWLEIIITSLFLGMFLEAIVFLVNTFLGLMTVCQ